ncbi:MAG: hypothetical protein H0V30_02130 [Chitinophagaceae bacterium]|nr:hypothetical protein [Chitinophagaceae bacterium]
MALRKLALAAIKEKHHIPKIAHARSKVELLPVFRMELVFLSRGSQFIEDPDERSDIGSIFLQP